MYNIVASTDEHTLVSEYQAIKSRVESYESEADLEKTFISDLKDQGYEYLTINSESALINNLRQQLERLNNFIFTDDEWSIFFKKNISNENEGILEKTEKIQKKYIQELHREDGSTKNVYLIDKKNIHNNCLQVINQYEENEGNHNSRYDVSILVNGLPLVHVELKRRGVAIREAFNQIKRYQRDSFWAGSGLYEYIQIFVISNGTNTKYYSNTTRDRHIKENFGLSQRSKTKKSSNSFEFTSYWSDFKNNIISDLRDFTRSFFAKHALLNILTKYCVLTVENALLVMRPYQIAATEQILTKIAIATNYKKYGTIEAGGYVWHTTGSGKTLTSFKTAQLVSQLTYIHKVLFVVDRKDLDYQTMKEYDRFEKGAANGNKSTRILQKQLEDEDTKIIVTTIQKLGTFIKKNPKHDVFSKRMVLIFDECHRSQFGEMHSYIIKHFKTYYLFGFTGTPIFAVNSRSGGNPFLKTTEQAFGEQLHSYTIVNAINDKNVLPFRVDYVETVKENKYIEDKEVTSIDRERVLLSPERISKVVSYILEHFDQKTKRSFSYSFKGQRVMGFNSLFAVASIPAAMAYYTEFKKQLLANKRNLSIATIFSFAPNEEDPDDQSGILGDEELDTGRLDLTSRDFLDLAIQDYNQKFGTSFNTSAEEFENYYKDLSERMKKREVDLVIVVNMFLTGFDATTLNTLWVDKNLRMHGLIQAYSRTNRILNSVKTYGNIVCFRKLDAETDKALALFGNKNAKGIVLLKTFKEYYEGYEENGKKVTGYLEVVRNLRNKFPLGVPIVGEENQKDFVRLFGLFLRLRNILTAFDEFNDKEIINDRDRQDYQSRYIDIYNEINNREKVDKEYINNDVTFELELVRQDQINIDYILQLIEKYQETLCQDKDVLISIEKAIGSSPELRSKKDLIHSFIESINPDSSVPNEWRDHVKQVMSQELSQIIKNENLKILETHRFVDSAFRDGILKTTGIDLDAILPAISIFSRKSGENRTEKRLRVIELLTNYFQKYYGLI